MFFSYERVSEYIPFEPRLGLFFWFSVWIGVFFAGVIDRPRGGIGWRVDRFAALQNKN